MELSRKDIHDVFQDLIEGRISREDADRWAYARTQAFDYGFLVFNPKSDEDLLWDAVSYLHGIDMKVFPNDESMFPIYMFSIDDIKDEYYRLMHSVKKDDTRSLDLGTPLVWEILPAGEVLSSHRIRLEAEEAFREKSYARVIRLYEYIEPQLSKVERKKLEYCRKRV